MCIFYVIQQIIRALILKFEKKRCFPFKNGFLFPAPPIQSEEIAGSFQHCIGDGGDVRQVKLYSRLPCAQKRRKCKFVPRLLSMIADSRPSRFTANVPVVNASASNWQVLHLVWFSLQEFSKKVKNYSRKSRWFTNHAKVNAYFTDHGKIENSFPSTENIDSRITEKINPHSRFTQSKNSHSRVTKKVQGTRLKDNEKFCRPMISCKAMTKLLYGNSEKSLYLFQVRGNVRTRLA